MHEKAACQGGKGLKSMMEKTDSSDIYLVMSRFLGVFALLQGYGEVRSVLRLVKDQRLPKAA